MPTKMGGKYVVTRQTMSAASATLELAPRAVSIPMKAASMVPNPPGVRGMTPTRRATAMANRASRPLTSLAGMPTDLMQKNTRTNTEPWLSQHGQGEELAPLAHSLVGLVAEVEHPLLDPLRFRLVGEMQHPVDGPVSQSPDPERTGGAAEHEPEQQPRDNDHKYPEHGRPRRSGGVLARDPHEHDGQDGQPELERYDPDTGGRDSGADGHG